ncbi:MAG: hypothetical protein AMXMBFR80_04300 [Dehalococcoidia bacterium]
MHILYLDESGTHAEARHFVVAGLSLFERQTYHLAEEINKLQARYFPNENDPVELHASALRAPDEHTKPPYDSISRSDRLELLDSVYDVLANAGARLFAVVMEKTHVEGDPYERGFEQIVSRFDFMLSRVNRERDERNRGLVVLAESSYRENIEALARQIWAQGTRWGEMHNIADIPYFAPARNTRLLQLADFVVNAVYARYEHAYAKQFDKLAPCFDQEAGRMHGLLHLGRNRDACYCPACIARRALPGTTSLPDQ